MRRKGGIFEWVFEWVLDAVALQVQNHKEWYGKKTYRVYALLHHNKTRKEKSSMHLCP